MIVSTQHGSCVYASRSQPHCVDFSVSIAECAGLSKEPFAGCGLQSSLRCTGCQRCLRQYQPVLLTQRARWASPVLEHCFQNGLWGHALSCTATSESSSEDSDSAMTQAAKTPVDLELRPVVTKVIQSLSNRSLL
ncbi:unnamed protein product [Effrenium voratum]|uniref:Uncharacterized protein n=1 Tax=Effrenium voratum TaxID=2562239 RepID=A0AA36MTZ6_9DINO|nr:unnamed protein product [Effrenium voratum]